MDTAPLTLICYYSPAILQVNEERESGRDHDNIDLKHGEVDPQNTPHVGGGNWAGGTGKSVCLSVWFGVWLYVRQSVIVLLFVLLSGLSDFVLGGMSDSLLQC